MHRGKYWNRLIRDEERRNKRNTWFTKGYFNTVLFVDVMLLSEPGFSDTESLLEHPYQIALIYQHGEVFDKNLYIYEDS